MSEWIKVEDGLPEADEQVIVTIEDEEHKRWVGDGTWSKRRKEWVQTWDGFSFEEENFIVIAWQSLPEPYQDVQNVNCTQKGRE